MNKNSVICKFHKLCARKKPGKPKKQGFTLIEILVVIGIIAVLAAVVLVAVNPSRQFKLARDSQRVSNVNSILNAVDQNIAEHGGLFICGASSTVEILSIPSLIADGHDGAISPVDIASCLVPAYISSLPFDPSVSKAHYTDPTNYYTGYYISQDIDGRITVSANSEISSSTMISVTR